MFDFQQNTRVFAFNHIYFSGGYWIAVLDWIDSESVCHYEVCQVTSDDLEVIEIRLSQLDVKLEFDYTTIWGVK